VIRGLFVTGTDTGVGKTRVTGGLVRRLRAQGIGAVPVKAVQTGAARDARGRLHASDVDEALAIAGVPLPEAERDALAIYAFEPACSPHLAARLAGEPIALARIREAAARLAASHGAVVVEGAGGVLVPLGPDATVLDLAAELRLPAVVVARAGLGTLNHVLLTVGALRGRGVPVAGVVLNDAARPEEEARFIRDDNARALEERGVPVLARVPWCPDDVAALDAALAGIDVERLLSPPRPAAPSLRARAARAVWHPYTDVSAFESSPFPVIDRAEGCSLFDVDGKELLDGISSWWCVSLGHGHPRIVEAIRSQASRLQHVLLGGVSHPRAIELGERLASLAPGGLGHAMFAADGSVAVEAALKIALQYWAHRGEPGRTRFVALEGGYHGDTLGAVGVGFVETFHAPFREAVRPALRAPAPRCDQCALGEHPVTCGVECAAALEALLERHHAQCAAVVVEPLLQAAAGMRMYCEEYLRRVRLLCDRYGLLLVADEIATGFGRTGAMFACERAGVVPDLLCLGKGLTGGTLPMSATLVSDGVFDAFRAVEGRARTFFHGTTFCGNPVAAAAALAALDVYRDERIVEGIPARAAILREGMARVARRLGGAPVRSLGLVAALDVPEEEGGAARARAVVARALELGLFIRPLGAVLYLWPPLNAPPAALRAMLERLEQAAHDTAAR
jgi:adenosylmethionine-8-amino-7-oxononanoate aminotransferase